MRKAAVNSFWSLDFPLGNVALFLLLQRCLQPSRQFTALSRTKIVRAGVNPKTPIADDNRRARSTANSKISASVWHWRGGPQETGCLQNVPMTSTLKCALTDACNCRNFDWLSANSAWPILQITRCGADRRNKFAANSICSSAKSAPIKL